MDTGICDEDEADQSGELGIQHVDMSTNAREMGRQRRLVRKWSRRDASKTTTVRISGDVLRLL